MCSEINSSKNASSNREPGRPMSPEVHRAILGATVSLLERIPVRDLTISAIARESGVSRTAIYRRWSLPRDIALEAYLDMAETNVPTHAELKPIDALYRHIQDMVAFMGGKTGHVICQLVGEAQADPEMKETFRTRLLAPRRRKGRSILERGIDAGHFRSVDIEMAIDLYAGPVYFRALLGHGALDQRFGSQIADSVLRAIQA